MLKLKANKRDDKKKVEELRDEGFIPAVVYGPKQEAINMSIKTSDFLKAYNEAGDSTIISLNVDGEEIDSLVQDVQYDPVKGDTIHVDFYAIERGKKLQVEVELIFEGLAPAEKNLSALIVKVMHEIEVECLPRNLPHNLTVNLEQLVDFESQILAKDIELPEGVELITNSEEVIALAKEAVEEELDEPVEALDMDSIEVEKKGKEDSEAAEESKTEKSE